MKKLNEKEIISIFQKKLKNHKFISEDVEMFSIGKTNCVIKVDTLVESTDIPPGMKLIDAARKSVVACVSDFASKGVKPLYGLISLTIPKRFSKLKITDIATGIGNAAKEFDLRIIGGDTNEGKELVIQISLLGFTKKIIPRNGAKTNDIIVTTGPFGYTSVGLKILLNKKKASTELTKKAKSMIFRPISRLKFGIKNIRYFSAAMDSSDGLSTCLNEMASQSKKKIRFNETPYKSRYF